MGHCSALPSDDTRNSNNATFTNPTSAAVSTVGTQATVSGRSKSTLPTGSSSIPLTAEVVSSAQIAPTVSGNDNFIIVIDEMNLISVLFSVRYMIRYCTLLTSTATHEAVLHHTYSNEDLESPLRLIGKRILVVDDSPMSLKIVGVVLKKLGACFDTAGDGAQALELIRISLQTTANNNNNNNNNNNSVTPSAMESANSMPHQYDGVIIDNYMPVMNGPEACREMRKIGYLGPILGLTGDVSQENVDIFMSSGALYVFQKPFDLNTMKAVLNKHIGGVH